MRPTEFTVRQLREATDTPPTVAFDCAVWLANRGRNWSTGLVVDAEQRIINYTKTRERK